MDPLTILRQNGLLDPAVLAVGFERGWIDQKAIAEVAVEKMLGGDAHPEAVELATCEDLDAESTSRLLHRWAGSDRRAPSMTEDALRRWQFAFLKALSVSQLGAEEQVSRLEEIYAMLGYPDSMKECSRYYVPPDDRARGLQVGDMSKSPLDAMTELLTRLSKELGVISR